MITTIIRNNLLEIRKLLLTSISLHNISRNHLVIRGEINCWSSLDFEVGYLRDGGSLKEDLYFPDELKEFKSYFQSQLMKYLKENNIHKFCKFWTREISDQSDPFNSVGLNIYIGFMEEVFL